MTRITHHISHFVGALVLAFCGVGAAAAQDASVKAPVVVELFTSQGCSSCPPADEYLGQIADREDVIALSLHVDYWDYLGWKDVYGLPGHSDRQRSYAAFMKERMIYTPQIVVNGQEGMVGSRTAMVEDALKRHSRKPAAALVEISLMGDRLVVDIAPVTAASGHVLMAWYSRAENVTIGAGENSGRKIVYHNVVRGWADLGRWRGGRIALTAPKPMSADGVAVLVQDESNGHILGAGRLSLLD